MTEATPFARAVELLEPGAGGKAIVALLDGKANRTTALDWRSGRRRPPKWAFAILAAKLRAQTQMPWQLAMDLERLNERPGKKAGAANLAAYRARRA